jgi:predicted small lipoprotein YifL
VPKFLFSAACLRLALLSCLVSLAACGQKGPLYIPEPAPESAPSLPQNESN